MSNQEIPDPPTSDEPILSLIYSNEEVLVDDATYVMRSNDLSKNGQKQLPR